MNTTNKTSPEAIVCSEIIYEKIPEEIKREIFCCAFAIVAAFEGGVENLDDLQPELGDLSGAFRACYGKEYCTDVLMERDEEGNLRRVKEGGES